MYSNYEAERREQARKDEKRTDRALMLAGTWAISSTVSQEAAKTREQIAGGLEAIAYAQNQEAERRRLEEQHHRAAPEWLFKAGQHHEFISVQLRAVVTLLENLSEQNVMEAGTAVISIGEHRQFLQQIDPAYLTRYEDKDRRSRMLQETQNWISELERHHSALVELLTAKAAESQFELISGIPPNRLETLVKSADEWVETKNDIEQKKGEPGLRWFFALLCGAGAALFFLLPVTESQDPAAEKLVGLVSLAGCICAASLIIRHESRCSRLRSLEASLTLDQLNKGFIARKLLAGLTWAGNCWQVTAERQRQITYAVTEKIKGDPSEHGCTVAIEGIDRSAEEVGRLTCPTCGHTLIETIRGKWAKLCCPICKVPFVAS